MIPLAASVLNAPPADPPWARPRFRAIPGTGLVGPDDWVKVSDTFAGQMALRDALVADRPGAVLAALPGSEAALDETRALLISTLARRPDYTVTADAVTRPDGVTVPLSLATLPLLARLVQEDVCLLQKQGPEYVLVAATLLFPSLWRLDEKIGHPMTRIHRPVAAYDAGAAKRVARLFDGLKPGLPIERWNGQRHVDAALHQPRSETAPALDTSGGAYYRSERQCLLRLPETGAILFTIHTRLWRLADLDPRPPLDR